MDRTAMDAGSESRFAAFVGSLSSILGHVDRIAPFRSYCTGLILPGDRKSVEPIAARVEPARVQAAHQSLHHFVAKAEWSDEAMLRQVRAHVLPMIETHGPIKAWIIDDTGFPKQGIHSVGVTRQYCGQLGKQDNCQVAVSLSVANDHASLPIAFRLYLPEDWAKDSTRREKAGVPADIVFKTKPQIALDQIRAAQAEGVPGSVVLADAGYGINTAFRTALTAMGLVYVVGIQSSARLWAPGTAPLPPRTWSGRFGSSIPERSSSWSGATIAGPLSSIRALPSSRHRTARPQGRGQRNRRQRTKAGDHPRVGYRIRPSPPNPPLPKGEGR